MQGGHKAFKRHKNNVIPVIEIQLRRCCTLACGWDNKDLTPVPEVAEGASHVPSPPVYHCLPA